MQKNTIKHDEMKRAIMNGINNFNLYKITQHIQRTA